MFVSAASDAIDAINITTPNIYNAPDFSRSVSSNSDFFLFSAIAFSL